MFERFTEDARQAVVLAQEESRSLGHPFVAAEHLLLGILRSPGAAGTTLQRLGARESEVRLRVTERLGPGAQPVPHTVPLLPETRTAVAAAGRVADDHDSAAVGTQHVLGALLEGAPIAALLGELGLPVERIRAALLEGSAPPERTGRESPADPRHPDGAVVVWFGDVPIGDLGNARVDARLLLAIILNDRGVADWLRERGVDERAVREHFGGFDLGWDEPPAPR